MNFHHPETARLMERSENPEGVDRAATSTSLLSAHSNTNSNANSDVAGIDLRGAVTERLSGNGILLNQSPVSSGQSSPCSTSDISSPGSEADPAEGSLPSIVLPNTSPIAGDLPPSAAIPNITSPLLGFEPSNEHTHSPNAPSSAQYHPKPENQGISVTARIAVSPTTSSPSLFQHTVILDPRSHLSIPSSSMILPHNLTASIPLDDNEPQVCLWDNCGVEFPNLHSLVSHLDRGHTLSMVKYICLWKDCPRNLKPFDARYKLITHLRCHTGEKPYVCDIAGCGRAFSRLENLKLHVRTHTGEKPYVCHYENCNKRFNNTSDRAKHMKTHVTRKPYACKYPGCSKCYTDPSSMRKHVKFAHRLSGASGNGISQRSSRKLSTASSTGSSTPSTPTTGVAMVVQRPPAPIAFSPMGTILPTNFQRFAQPIYIQSSSNSNNPSPVVTTSPTTNSIPPPLLPVLQPGGASNQPVSVIQPGIQVQYMQTGNPQQPLVMLVPNSGNANDFNNGTRDYPPKVVSLPPGIQLQRLISPNLTTRTSMQQTPSSQQLPTLEQPVSYIFGTKYEQSLTRVEPQEPRPPTHQADSDHTQNEKPSSIESELRQQIAELKEQLLHTKQAQALHPTMTTSISATQPVCMIQPTRNLHHPAAPLRGDSPTKVANAVVRILQPSQNPHSHMQGQMVALQQAQLPVAIPSPSTIPTQLIQPTSARQLTLVNPAQILNVTPRQNGPCIVPQFMVPGTQVLPFMPSQGVTPQIVHLAPLSNET